MSRAKGLFLWAGAAVGLSGVAFGQTAPAVSNDEVRAIVAEIMADTQGRTSLLQGGATAGHDGRFFIASPDGSFRLNVGGQIQFRYLINIDDEDDTVNEDEFDVGFQTRRTKLDFTGNVINKDWTFRILSNFDRDGGAAFLEEAWVGYNFGNGWKARWGQFKLPLLREELVSSSRQLAVERSVVNEAFTQDRSQGIELAYEQEDWNLKLAFSDGLDSENTDFTDQTLRTNAGFRVMGEADYAFTGRFEYKFAGTWSRFADFTSRQGDDFAAMVGVAAHWQQGPNTNNANDFDRQTFQFTGDVSLEGDGWNAFGAIIGRWESFNVLGGDDFEPFDWGFVVQGGYRFAPETEVFARFDALFLDDDERMLDEDFYPFITFGVNQYYAGHAAKATVDLLWALEATDELGAGFSSTGLGLSGSSEDNEIVIRLQFQFGF
jgi:hypothetical protein